MDNTIGDPHVVAAGRGSAWWASGWRVFAANVFTWIGMVLIYYVLSVLLSFIPFIGSIAQALLTPVFIGGIMLGCDAIARGDTLRIAHLFEGFQGTHFTPLLVIGIINMALLAVLALIGAAGAFGVFSSAMFLAGQGIDPMDAMIGSARAMTGTGLLFALVMVVVGAMFAMANWFAPALVALRGARAWDAMKASFRASLRNWAPFLVYGLIALAVVAILGTVVMAIAFGFLAGAIGGMNNAGWAAMFAFMAIIAVAFAVSGLIVGPMVFGSTYAGYTDIFGADEEALPNPAYR